MKSIAAYYPYYVTYGEAFPSRKEGLASKFHFLNQAERATLAREKARIANNEFVRWAEKSYVLTRANTLLFFCAMSYCYLVEAEV